MSHENSNNYASKHPEGAKADDRIATALQRVVHGSTVRCVDAEACSRNLGVEMFLVGRTADLLNLKISECQLGLFGCKVTSKQEKAIVPSDEVDGVLAEALGRKAAEGRISCEAVWEIAMDRCAGRMEIASACEALNLKIKPCQLGAF